MTYDDIGNPTNDGTWEYTWEMGRQLKTMSKTGSSLSFKYNSSGIRTEKVSNGVTTNYHLVGDKVTFESNGTDKIYYTYESSGNLVSMNLNGVEYYYIRNAQGDIIGLLSKSGTQVAKYTYDSWGKLISIINHLGDDVTNNTGAVGYKNPYRYRGYRYDTETGLYYLQSRYYNPEWGRFINADGIIGATGELLSHNMYAYCANNSVTMKDPSGFAHMVATDGGIDVDMLIFAEDKTKHASPTIEASKKIYKNTEQWAKEGSVNPYAKDITTLQISATLGALSGWKAVTASFFVGATDNHHSITEKLTKYQHMGLYNSAGSDMQMAGLTGMFWDTGVTSALNGLDYGYNKWLEPIAQRRSQEVYSNWRNGSHRR